PPSPLSLPHCRPVLMTATHLGVSMRRMARFSSVLMLSTAVVVMSGCSSHKHSQPSSMRRVSPLAWRDAMNDWFDNDRFDRPHSCAAVKEAARELPSDFRARALPAFRRYEGRVC